MSGPWYNADLYGWIPGTAFGLLAGLWGCLVGALAPWGRARRLVFGATGLLLAGAAALLFLGLVALLGGQPFGVWYGLGLPGVLGLVVIGINVIPLRLAYRAAERRKMAARDLS